MSPSKPPRSSSSSICCPSDPSFTEAPTTATERASSIRWSGVRSRFGHERFLIALSFTAARYAFQPGMPLTPPPAWVAEEPWYRPLIGVRKSA